MQINKENYEQYILDYLEGNLSPAVMSSFELFLTDHPEIRELLFQPEPYHLQPHPAYFADKSLLHKEPADVFKLIPPADLKSIAWIEKDLSVPEMDAWEEQLRQYPELRKNLTAYERTLLHPPEVRFDTKYRLKKSVPLISSGVYRWAGVLAAILLVVFLFRFFIFQPASEEMVLHRDVQGVQSAPANIFPKNKTELKPLIAGKVPKSPDRLQNSKTSTALPVQDASHKVNQEQKERIASIDLLPSPAAMQLPHLFSPTTTENRLVPPVLYLTEPLQANEVETLNSFQLQKFRLRILNPYSPAENYPPFWLTLADLGVKEINKITHWNLSLNSGYNDQGNISSLAFHSGILEFYSDLNKSNNE